MSYEAKPLTTTSVAKAGTSEEEQQTQSMMYAARMTYLDNSEQRSPDPMFLTRKQAQKMAQQQQEGLKMPFRRLEKMNTARATNGPTVISWKKSKAAMAALEKHKTWKPRFQAGCHFYECVETGECRVYPQGNPALMPSDENKNEADSDDDDPPFPDSFAFLNDSRK
ncbi:hypothetical protein F441_02616 [Phytophthora nicotianae CJ01A1]|uniref:Uncharacterized protein n=5 Tax=Phytophthora nicotianae TaxID=4792 RepID=W2PCC9_PHYN3|nr:hypothetical protein PPTG_19291 [Phytophthora nicotianae INRA-310]ETI54519.1 hypothetical protein F443_02654 [Phytophthora nicotianae P1569]ETK94416.1 hypothetical protein L915_02536 [Phytophthora nicotianae]ETO83271.1 hypothetical protein F444_02655 [Phytophthora nicotianae P1976]ETP24350.1 hypothetical protein F441_02616 [Phytophthora nicotianae CJ01A1]KUF98006.1 hypothetical protein AM588_10007307 [Phytophthora nicotianae]